MTSPSLLEKIDRSARIFAGPLTVFFLLPYFMVLLVLGTVSQKDLGLYDAVQTYIYQFIVWMGPIPLPGGGMVLSVIFAALFIKFIFYSPWRWDKGGIILSHLSILLLLAGGLLTAITAKEGFMIIAEGEQSNAYSDYFQRVLSIETDNGQTRLIPFDTVQDGETINLENAGISLRVLRKCDNCDVQSPSGAFDNLKGLAENMELSVAPSEKSREENFSGMMFEAIENDQSLGTWLVMEDINRTPAIPGTVISIKRAQTPLPFAIRLNDFRKIDYPGTSKASDYESRLSLIDEDINWPVTVRMNEPLRYGGYVFYQSSFDQSGGQEITVLNVVKNSGRIFPYVSSFVLFLGLMFHSWVRLRKRALVT
jgi:hypothetical protein